MSLAWDSAREAMASRDRAVEAARETEAIRDRLLAEIAAKREHPWRYRWATVRDWV